MNQHLQTILNLIQQAAHLSADEKTALSKATNNADKDFEITTFKLDRTEKVKRTTAILLEETIEELEQKRKAVEAQNRELEIESSLERVRTTAMGMRKPDDLLAICEILFTELQHMGFSELRNAMINIHDDDKASFLNYDFSEVSGPTVTTIVYNSHPATESLVQQVRKSNDAFAEFTIKGSQLDEWREYRKGMGEKDDPRLDNIDTLSYYFYSIGTGAIGISTYSSITEEKRTVLKRFRNVFDFAYRRYTDVAQAEAQAKEAQIQLAMERVRARTMAMQKSDELAEVSSLLFQQLKSLGVKSYSSGFTIWDNDHNELVSWMCNADSSMNPPFRMPIAGDAWHSRQYESWKNGEEFILKDIAGEEMQSYFRYLRSFPLLNEAFEKSIAAGHSMPEKQVHNVVNFANGNLLFITLEPCPEAHDIFKRFTKIFEQTYTRFLDLQKAEAQAREAQIEAALERVRSRTIGMQRSDELQGAALLLFQQAEALGVKAFACGFNIWDEDKKFATAWMGSVQGLQNPFKTDSSKDIYLPIYQAAQRGDAFFVREQSGEELKVHYDYLATIPIFRDIFMVNLAKAGFAIPSFQIIHCAFFAQGYLMFISYEPCPEAYDIFKRFAKVFEQTYTRFLDLQKAEAQALEAVKRASVDRVRAEIASMRTTNDLERITPLIWRELTTIGVPFIRCGVFIMDDEMQQVHTFLSTPDGAAIAAFHQPYNAPGETAQIIANWQKKKIYKQHWDEAQFIEFTKNPAEQGAITNGEKYLTETRPTNLDLHFLPFIQGMLYVGNTTPLSDDDLQLVQNLADAFSTAYARYEDFNKLESAKEQIEKTLVDLKQTQAQLVQSAKMASLGELTAGIAHEIQNPLNFVNNFSEVNKEMLEELKVERLKPLAERDEQTESEIIEDVIVNSEKINHHGKRADAIVKGMLQHSRSSTSAKEPTNINALADEYFRLAYHGLRAKDKAFNATLKTDFDESIGNVNVIPQDIGRVILNMINNAFYAVDEKKKQHPNGYEPTVSIATKKFEHKVLISIKDNGNGVPQKVLDKIFQPFFTTKPTGQGTGLGLSLSYDIIKAHGGEIKVESIEGKETTFNILLPNKHQS